MINRIQPLTYSQDTDAGHGRIEEREVTCCNDIDWLVKDHLYLHLGSIIRVTSRRFVADEWSQETRYFISSITHNEAQKYAHYVRTHWCVENSLHWTLDMAFDEDSCRIRTGAAEQNMTILRHISLNLLKSETEAGWDNDYLLKVLQIF